MIRRLIGKKTHPAALPDVPAAGGGSLLRRMGPAGTPPSGGPGLGAPPASPTDARDVPSAQGHRTVPGLLRRARGLSQWAVPAAQARGRPQRSLLPPAGLLSPAPTVRHHG